MLILVLKSVAVIALSAIGWFLAVDAAERVKKHKALVAAESTAVYCDELLRFVVGVDVSFSWVDAYARLLGAVVVLCMILLVL